MANDATQILFPVARMVGGNLYKPNEKDMQGNPLTVKSGPNIGKPRVDYYLAIAIPKVPGQTHFAQKPANWPATRTNGQPNPYWGEELWRIGNAAFPQQAQSPSFAWKVTDGDSQIPNKKGRKPCEQEGYPGHWVVKLGGGHAPGIYHIPPGAAQPTSWLQPDAIQPGDFIEVVGTCSGNGQVSNPGIYVNHQGVCFRGYGTRIVMGLDPTSVGFGGGALPAGASATPVGNAMPTGGTPTIPAAPAPAVAVAMPPVPGSAPVPAAPTPVAPYAGHMAPPPIPAAPTPALPPALPPAAAPVMTAAAQGRSYEAFKALGWSDEQIRAGGYMV